MGGNAAVFLANFCLFQFELDCDCEVTGGSAR